MKMPWSRDKEPQDELLTSQQKYVVNELETERAETKAIIRNQSRFQWKRYLIMGGSMCGILALMASCEALNNTSNMADSGSNTTLTSTSSANSPGRFAATQAVNQWLAATPSPLPGGQMQGWTGALQLPKQESTDQTTGEKVEREMDSFTLVDGYGHGYSASVEVAYTTAGDASVIAGPSLTPLVTSQNSNFAGSSAWPGLESSDPSDAVSTAIQQWADVYTGGDNSALRQAVGDPSRNHVYTALTGITSAKATVSDAADAGDGNQMVQVSIVPQWAGRTYQNGQGPTPMQFDVLVSGPNTAAPRVVAWGSPGSGPTLKPYQNAVTMSGQSDDSSSSPSNSDNPTASPSSAPIGEGSHQKSAATDSASPKPSSTSAKPSSSSTSAPGKPSPSSSKK